VRDDDPRGRKIAVVSDAIVNGPGLTVFEREGWGVMQLPPRELDQDASVLWVENLADQVAEFLRHGYTVVAVVGQDDAPAARRLPAVPVLVLTAGVEIAPFLAQAEDG
jgi:hypothetical protein